MVESRIQSEPSAGFGVDLLNDRPLTLDREPCSFDRPVGRLLRAQVGLRPIRAERSARELSRLGWCSLSGPAGDPGSLDPSDIRIQGWQEKLLSKAGKEILVKAVAQASKRYQPMQCFVLM